MYHPHSAVHRGQSDQRLVGRAHHGDPAGGAAPGPPPATRYTLAVTERPALILLDLHLPDVGGDVLLDRFRVEPATAHTPVVIVSADAMADNVAGCGRPAPPTI